MIRGRGAAGQQQFGECQFSGCREHFRIQVSPNWVEGTEPVEQFLVQGSSQRACERLIKMVMGVDQPGQHNMGRGIERGIHRCCGHISGANKFCDELIFNDETALGAIGKDCKRVSNPQSRHDDYARNLIQNKKPAPVGAGFR